MPNRYTAPWLNSNTTEMKFGVYRTHSKKFWALNKLASAPISLQGGVIHIDTDGDW